MPLMRMKDDYTISDGVKFWMADEGRPVLCRVTHEALRDHADRVRLNVADDKVFEAYRELIEQVASDAYDAGANFDDAGCVLVTSEAKCVPVAVSKGARNKLSESFLNALADDFDAHGQDVIAKVRESCPHEYLRVIAATLPKRLETEPDNRPLELLTVEELTRIIRDTEQDLREFGTVNGGDERA